MRVHLAVLAAAVALPCAAAPAVAGTAATASVVGYACKVAATGQQQDVEIDVELTVPPQATAGEAMSIGWRGTIVSGKELVAPATGMEGELNMYVYAGISGIDGLTSATGVAEVGTVIPGEPVPLPQTATMTTTPRGSGGGTVHAASVNFGLTPQDRLVECEVKNTAARTEYPLTVLAADGSTGTPTPDATDTGTPAPDPSEDDDVPARNAAHIPSGGVDTGAGGSAGPDGRALMLTGLAIMLAAIVGLRLRRPRAGA